MTDVEHADLEALLETIYDRYHYDFRGYGRASLRRRATSAMATLGVANVRELTLRLVADETTFPRLLPWFTVQLSDLFRDPTYFRYFREHVVPWLRTYPTLKLWVAGCSTGEEAYSFAIILAEEGLLGRSLIYATDIYAPSLRIAEAGAYNLDRMRTFSENHRETGARCALSEHYTAGAHGALFDRGLRARIVFADHSLATDAVFAAVHVVSCRNVLIYFRPELQDRALGLFHEALVHHGWLGLGPKETVEFSTLSTSFAHRAERWYVKQGAPPQTAGSRGDGPQ